MPAAKVLTVLPLTEHTAGVVLAYTTGLVDGPPEALSAKLAPGAYTGAAGVALKPVIACAAAVIATSSTACGAAL